MKKASFLAFFVLVMPLTFGIANISRASVISPKPCAVLTPYRGRTTLTVEQRVAMAREEHEKLRALAKAQTPIAETMILIMLSSGHHTFTDISYIATRDKYGVWAINRVSRTTSEFSEIPPDLEPETRSVLSKKAGKDLDTLVADDCLYAQPFMTADSSIPPLNSWSTQLTVITPTQKYTGFAFGPIPSIGGKIVTAVTGW